MQRKPYPRFHHIAAIAVLLLIMCGVVLCPSTLTAQTKEVDSEQFQAIVKDYDESVKEALGDNRAMRKLRSKTSKLVLELTEDCEDSDLAIEMLNWVILRNGRNAKSKRALKIVLERYSDQPGIGDALDPKCDPEDLEAVLEKNNDATVAAVAKLFLAIRNPDEEAREKALLEIYDNHGDLKYRGAVLAKLIVDPLSKLKLRVGKVAPDIIGPDTDNVEFKLSDYRGKVVVIDFWGDW